MEIILIAAMAANRVIGRGSEIPWHLPGEQKRFKEITWGYPLIMGRKTFESIGRPLPGRRNIVITRNAQWQAAGWYGHARGKNNAGRSRQMHSVSTDLDADFPWLAPPILNDNTRFVMIADAARGRIVAQGIEARRAATEPLEVVA